MGCGASVLTPLAEQDAVADTQPPTPALNNTNDDTMIAAAEEEGDKALAALMRLLDEARPTYPNIAAPAAATDADGATRRAFVVQLGRLALSGASLMAGDLSTAEEGLHAAEGGVLLGMGNFGRVTLRASSVSLGGCTGLPTVFALKEALVPPHGAKSGTTAWIAFEILHYAAMSAGWPAAGTPWPPLLARVLGVVVEPQPAILMEYCDAADADWAPDAATLMQLRDLGVALDDTHAANWGVVEHVTPTTFTTRHVAIDYAPCPDAKRANSSTDQAQGSSERESLPVTESVPSDTTSGQGAGSNSSGGSQQSGGDQSQEPADRVVLPTELGQVPGGGDAAHGADAAVVAIAASDGSTNSMNQPGAEDTRADTAHGSAAPTAPATRFEAGMASSADCRPNSFDAALNEARRDRGLLEALVRRAINLLRPCAGVTPPWRRPLSSFTLVDKKVTSCSCAPLPRRECRFRLDAFLRAKGLQQSQIECILASVIDCESLVAPLVAALMQPAARARLSTLSVPRGVTHFAVQHPVAELIARSGLSGLLDGPSAARLVSLLPTLPQPTPLRLELLSQWLRGRAVREAVRTLLAREIDAEDAAVLTDGDGLFDAFAASLFSLALPGVLVDAFCVAVPTAAVAADAGAVEAHGEPCAYAFVNVKPREPAPYVHSCVAALHELGHYCRIFAGLQHATPPVLAPAPPPSSAKHRDAKAVARTPAVGEAGEALERLLFGAAPVNTSDAKVLVRVAAWDGQHPLDLHGAESVVVTAKPPEQPRMRIRAQRRRG